MTEKMIDVSNVEAIARIAAEVVHEFPAVAAGYDLVCKVIGIILADQEDYDYMEPHEYEPPLSKVLSVEPEAVADQLKSSEDVYRLFEQAGVALTFTGGQVQVATMWVDALSEEE